MATSYSYDVWRSAMLAGFLVWSGATYAQEPVASAEAASSASVSESVRELREQIRELQSAVTEIRSESQRYRAETAELRRQLEAVRAGSSGNNEVAAEVPAAAGAYG